MKKKKNLRSFSYYIFYDIIRVGIGVIITEFTENWYLWYDLCRCITKVKVNMNLYTNKMKI